jgi:hypothetical protein
MTHHAAAPWLDWPARVMRSRARASCTRATARLGSSLSSSAIG